MYERITRLIIVSGFGLQNGNNHIYVRTLQCSYNSFRFCTINGNNLICVRTYYYVDNCFQFWIQKRKQSYLRTYNSKCIIVSDFGFKSGNNLIYVRNNKVRIVSGFGFKSGNNFIYVHYSDLTIVSNFGFKSGNNLIDVRITYYQVENCFRF